MPKTRHVESERDRDGSSTRASLVSALHDAVRTTEGDTPLATRQAIMGGDSTGTSLDSYIDMVRFASYAIGPDHVQKLVDEGWTEDAIFEVTLAAAVSESHRRLAAGMAALEEAGS